MGFPKMVYSIDPLPLLLFLVTVTFMATPARSVLNNGEDLVSTTCNHTLYVELCESSLRSDLRSKTWDLQGLASIALNISIANGVRTRDHIHSLRSTADNKTLSSLNVCSEEYSDAVQNLQEAIGALRNRSFDSVNTLVSSAMTDSETCEEGFEVESHRNESPLGDKNELFQKLCSNFLAITALLSDRLVFYSGNKYFFYGNFF